MAMGTKNFLVVLVLLLGGVGVGAKPSAPRPAPNVRVAISYLQGNGCPAGTVSAQLSPDLASVSLLFDHLRTEIPATSVPINQKVVCRIDLKFQFVGKYRIAITGSDVRGFASVPSGSSSIVSVQHRSPFTIDPKILAKMNYTANLQGPFEDTLLMTTNFADKPLWSYCGTQGGASGFNLISIYVTIDSTNNNPEFDLITAVDSLDLNASPVLKYNLAWKYDDRNCP